MNIFKSIALSVLMLGSVVTTDNVSAAAAEPYPLEYFALREVISNVSMSPDGNKISLLKIPSKKGDPILEIYDANDLDKPPFRMNADPMEIRQARWISNDQLVLTLRQKLRDKIDGFNRGVYGGALAKLDLKTKKVKEFELKNQSPGIASLLIDKPNKILVSFNGDETYSPTDYYELDLKSGRKKLIIRGTPEVPLVRFDAYGKPIYGQSFDRQTGTFIWHVRYSDSNKWVEIYRHSEDSFEDFAVEWFDENNRDIFFVTAHNGQNTKGLWEFNVKTKEFGEPVYRRNDVDVVGVKYHSNQWTNPDSVTGVTYATDKYRTEYFDGSEDALFKQLESLIPHSHQIRVTARSKDGKSLIVYNAGPRDPGTYYMIKNGEVKTIGSTQPLLESSKLADVKYMNYESRDGHKMAMYVTIPNTKGPYPAVVMPHGGPFIHEVVGYDEWAQMLANNGYLVLQPEYRGSRGYGLEHYKSAFINGGEGGKKMQDDKDDAALYLVEQGLVDKDRIAMFGWSYGGYASFVAASREDQIYQCTIAGAGVADNLQQVNYYRGRGLRGASKVEQVRMWDDSISPIKEVEKVNVPMMVVHGEVDQRVPVSHSRKYVEELEKNGKTHKYVELEGADHFYNTLFFDHQMDLYTNLTGFLKNDCGPGGL